MQEPAARAADRYSIIRQKRRHDQTAAGAGGTVRRATPDQALARLGCGSVPRPNPAGWPAQSSGLAGRPTGVSLATN